jgi:hypothetical protein
LKPSKFVLGAVPFFFFSKKAVNDSSSFCVTSLGTGEARVVSCVLVLALFEFIEFAIFVSTGKGRRVVGGKLVLALFEFPEFTTFVAGGAFSNCSKKGRIFLLGGSPKLVIFYFIKIKYIFIELILLKLRT